MLQLYSLSSCTEASSVPTHASTRQGLVFSAALQQSFILTLFHWLFNKQTMESKETRFGSSGLQQQSLKHNEAALTAAFVAKHDGLTPLQQAFALGELAGTLGRSLSSGSSFRFFPHVVCVAYAV
jgi:hypothetical protein